MHQLNSFLQLYKYIYTFLLKKETVYFSDLLPWLVRDSFFFKPPKFQ